MNKEQKTASHPSKLVVSGPVHQHGLRASPARTAFLAQARTGSIAPVKHRASKTKEVVKKSEVKKTSEILEIFASNSGTAARPENVSQGREGLATKQVHTHMHTSTHSILTERVLSRLKSVEDPTTANSDGRGGASRVAQDAARDKQAISQTPTLAELTVLYTSNTQIPVQIPPAVHQGEGMVTLGVGTGLVSSDPLLIQQGGVDVAPLGGGARILRLRTLSQ